MSILSGEWIGRVNGTSNGYLFIDFEEYENYVSGSMKFRDDLTGSTVYNITGSYGDFLEIECIPIVGSNLLDYVEIISISVLAKLNYQGNLNGHWYSTVGTSGLFEAYPYNIKPRLYLV